MADKKTFATRYAELANFFDCYSLDFLIEMFEVEFTPPFRATRARNSRNALAAITIGSTFSR
jgi:hypothetical protein